MGPDARDRDGTYLALRAARVGTWELDPSTDAVRWSDAACEVLGFSPGELSGTRADFARLVHPEERADGVAAALEAALRGAALDVEFRAARDRGAEPRWVVFRGGSEQGRVAGVVGDVTERRRKAALSHQRDEVLREKQERLEAALAASATGTFRWDIRTNALSWDENLDRLFGLAPGQTARSLESFVSLVHPDDRAAVIARCERCRDFGADFDMEFRVVWPDGSQHWLSDRGRTFAGSDGRPAYMTGACVDVTERKRVEDALRESERRLRVLADTLPQMVWTAGPDGDPDYFNSRWFECTGHAAVEGRDPRWLEAVYPDDRARCAARWEESARTGREYEIEYRIGKEGAYRWYLGRGLPLRDAAGRVTRWFGTCTDIHDQKLAEAAQAEDARRKDQFLAMLAHELRNPLAPIRLAAEVLRLRSDPGTVERQRGIIERQALQLTRLVDDLLDVARVTRGVIQLRLERCDAASVLARAVEAVRPDLERRAQRLQLEVPAAPLWLLADPARLAQVFTNLLHNASKYSEPGRALHIHARREGAQVVIEFEDEGRGIPPHLLDSIFDVFMQVDTALDRASGGLGVGLTLVRALVSLHGGSVTAHSEGAGRGSRFRVQLPSAPEPADQLPLRVPAGAGAQRRRVLVVDDNRDAADTLAALLDVLGHEVRVAYDGSAGIALAADPPDVVLLDLGLPGLDGFEVARRMREVAPEAVLIALTGYGQPGDRERSQEAGFAHHVVKPAEPERLASLIAAT